ncbi:MAG: MMPL family transporter [Chloroflexi bacterium]|nr:MMPL family transporter [Chloroflexota bacterium]
MQQGFFTRFGAAVARWRWLVLALWLAAFVASVPALKNVKDALKSGGFEISSTESGQSAKILEDEFGRRTVTTGVAVFKTGRGTFTDPANAQAVTASLDRVSRLPGTVESRAVRSIFSFYSTQNRRFISEDGKATYAIVNFAEGEEESKKLTPTVRDTLKTGLPDGMSAYLMGFPALSYDLGKGSEEDLKKAEISSLPLTLLLLLLVFGTILAAGLPLILGLAAVCISLALIYAVALRSETSIFAMNTASMIGLGLGIDFSLLMVSRFREELEKGYSSFQATVNTVSTSGRSIVFSGLTVMLGLAVLLLYELVLVRSIAMAMLLVAGVAMLGAVTLLPALLAILGPALNAWPLRSWPVIGALFGSRAPQAAGHHGGGRWHDLSMAVMRRPWVFLILTVSVLLLLAYPAREIYAIGSGGARGMPEDLETRQAFDVIRDEFGAGEVTPLQVIIRAKQKDGAFDPNTLSGVYQLVKQLQADPRVKRVESLVLLAENASEQQFRQITPQLVKSNPQAAALAPNFVNIDRNNDTQVLSVVSKTDELDLDTINLVKDIRGKIVPSIPNLKSTDNTVTGQTALIEDYRDRLFEQFPLMVGLVLLVTYVVLMMFFHSLVLPLKAILMNVVSILASYGVLVLIFQHGYGDTLLGFDSLGKVSMFAPVILFSILFGLSTDYEVFLLSRVKELYRHTGNNELSVAQGLEKTAGIITAAGMIMIVVFGAFALGSTIVIKELGVGLAVAVLLDSTIIRILMVPASMKLMGSGNWWMPAWLKKIVPEIDEGGEAAPGPAPAYGHVVAPPPHGGLYPCPSCGALPRPAARFCGRCGFRVPLPVGMDPRAGMPGYGAGAVNVSPRAAGPQMETMAGWEVPSGAAPSGVRRILVRLLMGHQQHPAWLTLRDCQVEQDPTSPGAPVLHLNGVQVQKLSSNATPEIEIRNVRIRL